MKTKASSLLARFGVSALIVLLAGCSSDGEKLEKTLKKFKENCNAPIEAELYTGSWSRSLTVKCSDFVMKFDS